VAGTTSQVSGVAERYAKALFELAVEAKTIPQVEKDLDQLSSLVNESSDLARLVRSPVFSASDQQRAMSAVADKAGITGIVGNFVRVLAGNRRLFILPGVIATFKALAAKERGEVSAEVTSAEPLSDKNIAALKDALKASIGKDVTLTTTVDPTLIGGLIVKVGSRMIDGSLRTKLNSLKLAMKEVG
jgi:F-type H+-transporting ATPase subunit delta